MNALPPLWAAGWDELLPIILGILFILVPTIAQLLAKARQAQQGGGQAPGQPPQPQIQDEIGEFLRRAARARADAQAKRQAPVAGQAAKPQPRPPQAARPVPSKRPAQTPVVEAEADQPQVLKPDELGKRVAKDINTGRLERHARELGQHAARSDQKSQQRRHQVFQHSVGQLAAATTPAPQAAQPDADALPRTSAAGLAVLLADLQNLKQAIVLNEILRRPEERWQ